MGKCCKKKAGAKSSTSENKAAPAKAESAASSGVSLFRGATLGEAALAAGILIALPIILDRVAPNAVRSIRHGFELATKS